MKIIIMIISLLLSYITILYIAMTLYLLPIVHKYVIIDIIGRILIIFYSWIYISRINNAISKKLQLKYKYKKLL